MKRDVHTNLTREETLVTPQKLPYQTPKLTLFGAVTALTQSGSRTGAEGGNNQPCDDPLKNMVAQGCEP